MTESVFLVDTNIWLERLLNQARSGEVGAFLERVSTTQLAMTDFALHSIGIVLARLEKPEVLSTFVKDIFLDGGVNLVRLEPEDMESLTRTMAQYHLDFDDAYQYVAAEKQGCVIVSFDSDFDGTGLGRKEPADLRGG